MKVKIVGMEALISALGKSKDKGSKIQNVVKSNGSEMQQKAQKHAPVDTGFLKRDITLKIEDGGKTAIVKSEAEYAPYQEYGTRFQAGTPHIRPEFYEQKDKFISDLEKVAKE